MKGPKWGGDCDGHLCDAETRQMTNKWELMSNSGAAAPRAAHSWQYVYQ